MCSANKQLGMRQVCKHWKKLHDRYFKPQSRIYRLKIVVVDNELQLYGIKLKGEVVLSLPRNRDFLKRYFEITELIYNKRNLQSGTIILENEAACDYVLHLLAQKSWNIQKMELHGIALNVSAIKLCQFFALQRDNPAVCNINLFCIKNGIVSPGFISERLLNALQKSGTTFDIELDESCAESFYHNSLTDDGLERILRPNICLSLRFPFACNISICGLKNAIKKYFSIDWTAAENADPSSTVFANVASRNRSHYGCELKLQANSRVNLATVLTIQITGAEQRCYCLCGWHTLDINEVGARKERWGRVSFNRQLEDGKSLFIDVVLF
uniref:F-box domain-containing protein n=1 Tax=Syphacia muris TaxID=451379 RepID=A0A0N5AYI6_9BILA